MRRIAVPLIVMSVAAAAVPGARAVEVEDVLRALVRVEAEIPSDARTAAFLGTRREASGVVIDDAGLVLTIGYIILEAMSATVTDADGLEVPADVVAYDYDSGFGLLRAIRPIAGAPLRLGDSDRLSPGDPALVVAAGGAAAILPVRITRRDPFAGWWEYLLESAIYTAPAHPAWSGAALVGADGRMLGIGSLRLDDAGPGGAEESGNLFVPINLLKPILGELLAEGRRAAAPRPWMGLFTRDIASHVVVMRVIEDGPGARAGVQEGDVIAEVDGRAVADMADLFRKVWALGEAGVEVPLTVARGPARQRIVVRSSDRYRYLKLDPSY